MAEVSSDLVARSRKVQTSILQRLEVRGAQAQIARALEIDESTITRWKSEIERTAAILVQLGLKVVDSKKVCVPAGEIKFLRDAYNRVCEQAPWLLNEGEE